MKTNSCVGGRKVVETAKEAESKMIGRIHYMYLKKLIVSFITVGMIAVLAACGSPAPDTKDSSSENAGNEQQTAPESADYGQDTVAVVNGRLIRQDEFEYFVRYNVDTRAENGEQITDWEEEISDGVTVSDSVKEDALDWFIYAGGIHQQAARLGIELQDEDRAALEEQWKQFTGRYDSPEAAEEALAEQHCTPELYKYILETQYLSDRVFDSLYGEYGCNITDAECAVMTEGDGYLMAKHILLLPVKMNDDGTQEELPEKEKAEKLEMIRELKTQIDGAEAGERQALFDELMKEHSEDTGLEAYPEGYLFQEGDMVEEFYDATMALEEGAVSDIVQTTYGYHLIMRLPINYDVIPSAYSMYTAYGYDYLTLRYLCADEAFGASAQQWMERVEVEKTELYESLNVKDLILEEK